jgi:hypothetical protein
MRWRQVLKKKKISGKREKVHIMGNGFTFTSTCHPTVANPFGKFGSVALLENKS